MSKQMFNRIVWIMFNAVYLAYYTIEKVYPEETVPAEVLNSLKILGLISLIIMIIGCVGELIILLIDFLVFLYSSVKSCNCCEGNKIACESGEEERSNREDELKKKEISEEKEELQRDENKNKEEEKEKENWKTFSCIVKDIEFEEES